MKVTNPKYLRKHGRIWQLRVRIPIEAKASHPKLNGKTYLIRSLKTESLSRALQVRDEYLAWFIDACNGLITPEPVIDSSLHQSYYAGSIQKFSQSSCVENQQITETQNEILEVTFYTAYLKTLKVKQNVIKDKEFKRYKLTYDTFIKFIGDDSILMKRLRRKDISRFIEYLKQSQLGSKTITSYLGRLSSIYQVAESYEMVKGDNPFKGHRLSTKPMKKRSFYYPSQVKAIYEHLPEDSKLAWMICYFTGLRASELFSLNKDSIIELESASGKVRCFEIAKHGGKTENAARFIPIHHSLEPYLRDFDGFAISQSTFEKRRRKAVISLYGKEFADTHDTHSLRHTFITTLIDTLGNAELVEWLVGHSRNHRTVTYKNYFHGFGLDKLKVAVKSLENVFN